MDDARAGRSDRDSAAPTDIGNVGVWDDFFDAPGVDLGEREQPEPQARQGS